MNDFFNEDKSTVGIFNEFKAAMTTSIVVGTNMSISKTKDVKIVKDGKKLIVEKDKSDKILGKWTTDVVKDRILSVDGIMQYDVKKEIHLKSGKKFTVEAQDDLFLKSATKKVKIASASNDVAIQAGKNVDIISAGSSIKIHASGINHKGQLHQLK